MKEVTIVCMEDNGEQYEDYHDWVSAIYLVETDRTGADLEAEWKAFVVAVMAENDIRVNPNWMFIETEGEKLPSKKKTKLWEKLRAANRFGPWLEANHKVRNLNEFTIIHQR